MKFPIEIGKYTITYCPFDNEYEVTSTDVKKTFTSWTQAISWISKR